jgi:ABC transporter, phosphonate, periplasmic substrate-binding protein
MRRMSMLALALLAALGGSDIAYAQKQQVTIAIFAPNAPFEDSAKRFAYAQALAEHVTKTANVQATAKAFARSSDFESAVKKGQVDFAIVDAVYLAERGIGSFKVLATATVGGQTTQAWRLYAATTVGATSPSQLTGKRLAYASAGSSKDTAFLENALFEGVVPIAKFFGKREIAPDVASAVSTVSLGKADAVFAPDGRGKGLKPVGDALARIPLPAFCVAKSEVPQQTVSSVTSAIGGFSLGGTFDGWKASGAGPYEELSRRMAPRTKRPLMADPELVRFEDKEALNLGTPEPALPDLSRYYVMPAEK